MNSSRLPSAIVMILLFGTVHGPSLSVAQQESSLPTQKYALLVGINGYSKPLSNLDFCQNDSKALRTSLLGIGFAEDNVVFMSDGSQESRYLPSKANILREMDLLLAMAGEEDLVLLAFSGHGVHVDGASYLCPFDAALDRVAETMVSLDEVYQRLQQCKAAQKVLLVDACRNEPLTKGFRAPGSLKGFVDDLKEPPKGVWMLTSCGPGQWSTEDSSLKHGVFMHYAMEALSGKADQECAGNRDGKVTLDELFHYANQKTMNHVRRSFGIVQKPMREGRADGDYVIASVSSIVKPPASEPGPEKKDVDQNEVVTVGAAVAATTRTRSSVEHPLLAQADTYLRQVDYVNAISAYSAVIDDLSLPVELRRKARKSRCAAYLGRGDKADLDKAIVDQQAAGLPGILLTIQKESSPLQVDTELRGTVVRNQVVLVTLSDGDWLWVDSINGDETLQGYISKDAVIVQRPAAKPAVAAPAEPQRSYSQSQYDTQNSYSRPQYKRPPSVWETPEWESPREIREKRARGELR